MMLVVVIVLFKQSFLLERSMLLKHSFFLEGSMLVKQSLVFELRPLKALMLMVSSKLGIRQIYWRFKLVRGWASVIHV